MKSQIIEKSALLAWPVLLLFGAGVIFLIFDGRNKLAEVVSSDPFTAGVESVAVDRGGFFDVSRSVIKTKKNNYRF